MKHTVLLNLEFSLPVSIEADSKEDAELKAIVELAKERFKVFYENEDCCEELRCLNRGCLKVDSKERPRYTHEDTFYICGKPYTFVDTPPDYVDLYYPQNSITAQPRRGQKITEVYKLQPVDGRQSFYNKACVKIDSLGNQILYSYNTPVVMKDPGGNIHRLWDGWSQTTGRHIKAFCGLNKSQLDKLETEEL